jgi:hypothetical protein
MRAHSFLLQSILWLAVTATLWVVCAKGGEALPQAARDQVDAERHAMRLVGRASLQARLAALETEWQRKSPELLPSTLTQTHGALQELAFLVALETINSDARRPRVVQISLPAHHWLGLDVPGGRWGIDNPDTQYFIVPVEAASSYVIRGLRRAPGPVDSNFSFGTLDDWGTIANIGQDQLQVGANGEYTITLDRTPANGRANHIQLTNEGNSVFIRNTLADWSRENVDRLAVRRVSGAPAGPRPTDDELERMMIARLDKVIAHIVQNLQGPIISRPANVLPQPGNAGDKVGFLVTQRNAIGHFRLRPDEALVATFNPGGAAYSTFPVTNVWGVSPDYGEHQCSLNNRQAVANADGRITVVLSALDPGVANWVDTSGLEEGFIMLRWQGLPPHAHAGEGPGVTSQVVKWAELPAVLPAGLKRVTAAERKAALAERKAGFERRFVNRWK